MVFCSFSLSIYECSMIPAIKLLFALLYFFSSLYISEKRERGGRGRKRESVCEQQLAITIHCFPCGVCNVLPRVEGEALVHTLLAQPNMQDTLHQPLGENNRDTSWQYVSGGGGGGCY